MSLGRLARRILGPAFPLAGAAYRRFFVDMDRIADWLAEELDDNSRLLDIGGGDGFVVEKLLNRKSGLQVTMSDLALDIGSFISESNIGRVVLRPGVGHSDIEGAYDAISLTDVIHHVPLGERKAFLAGVAATAQRLGARKILVKDIEPEGPRARLAVWTDHHITGDKNVSPAPSDAISFPGFSLRRRAVPDHPNYCLVFERSN